MEKLEGEGSEEVKNTSIRMQPFVLNALKLSYSKVNSKFVSAGNNLDPHYRGGLGEGSGMGGGMGGR